MLRNFMSLMGLIWGISGCTQMQSNKLSLNLSQSFFTPGQGGPIPVSDRLSSDCAASADFDACLFRKNPVAQEGKVLALDKWNEYRRFGVKIRGIRDSIYLENPWLQIHTVNSPRASLLDVRQFKTDLTDEQSVPEQVSAYYWANRVIEYSQSQVGESRMPLRGLKIFADDGFTGYVSKTKSIHLEKNSGRGSKALSGDVVAHLLGEAVADSLSGGRLFTPISVQHKNCAQKPNGCCASSLGCSAALASAFGDYVTGMLFPDSARLGEALSGQVSGQSICGWSRDLSSVANTTASEAFTACAASDAQMTGHTTIMGLWYAGQWWALRSAAQSQDPSGAADIDSIFFEHAKQWRSISTFQDAKRAAVSAAATLKGGKYSALVQRYLP